MSDVQCPCCNKGVQSRHTYMANLPATVVCTGCGSWFKVDAGNSGGSALVGLSIVTVILAYFWPIMLVFLPVYFVMSMGRLESFTVELVHEPRAELWTISRETGEIRKLDDQEAVPGTDTKLSDKLANVSPREINVFREKAQKYRALRARMVQRSGAAQRSASSPSGPPQLSH
ncbi:MAG: hypothetical protein AB3N28_15530 [Kordiimonas sp.]